MGKLGAGEYWNEYAGTITGTMTGSTTGVMISLMMVGVWYTTVGDEYVTLGIDDPYIVRLLHCACAVPVNKPQNAMTTVSIPVNLNIVAPFLICRYFLPISG